MLPKALSFVLTVAKSSIFLLTEELKTDDIYGFSFSRPFCPVKCHTF